MGLKKRAGLWVDASRNLLEATNVPDHFKLFCREWLIEDRDLDFSLYWNRFVGYPHCRYYSRRKALRFYFKSESEITAWLLGADLTLT